ncbi:helix-turn-helix domain-containing protein [Novosphingobium sp. CF614]|uniref:helix-turn-helix domain-containing protein n=1 Tax=Novosphingobium sp. CF614 TaxID=1884364 RepID=UPI0015A4FAD8
MTNVPQHEHIKWALSARGTSLSAIARALGVAPTSVTMVCKGRGRSRRIEEAIADAAGFTPAQLWPANYPDQQGDTA